jgi:hypothetical protein
VVHGHDLEEVRLSTPPDVNPHRAIRITNKAGFPKQMFERDRGMTRRMPIGGREILQLVN